LDHVADVDDVNMSRVIGTIVLLAIAVVSATGLLANIWAESFRDPFYEVYLRHSYICLLSLIFSLSALIILLLSGKWKWRKPPVKHH
jgi:Ca2+/Na+ antiporter